MPMTTEGDLARLDGAIAVEEAEALVAFFEGGGRRVDLAGLRHLHSAVLQTLMAYRPVAAAWPEDAALRGLLEPVLRPVADLLNDAA